MLVAILAAAVLGQAPSAAEAQPERSQAVSNEARPASSRRRPEAVTCTNRAPTGSTLRRDICRTERRANAERRASQEYIADVTRGTVHEPPPL